MGKEGMEVMREKDRFAPQILHYEYLFSMYAKQRDQKACKETIQSLQGNYLQPTRNMLELYSEVVLHHKDLNSLKELISMMESYGYDCEKLHSHYNQLRIDFM